MREGREGSERGRSIRGSHFTTHYRTFVTIFILLLFTTPDSNGLIAVVEDGIQKELPLALEDILIFSTGAFNVPPMGFEEQPSISFKKAGGDLPTASTCTNTLYIPTVHANNYETCKYKFVLALTGAVGFGQV